MTQRSDKTPAGKSPTESQKQQSGSAPTGQSSQTGTRLDNPPAAEHGGRPGLDPTRYGDWEKNGRCIDF